MVDGLLLIVVSIVSTDQTGSYNQCPKGQGMMANDHGPAKGRRRIYWIQGSKALTRREHLCSDWSNLLCYFDT